MSERPTFEIGRRHRAGGSRDLAAVQRERDRGNAAHAETLGEHRGRVDIDFDEAQARLEARGGAREFRRHDAAGAAPGGPEVDQQRDVAFLEVPVEAGGIERHGMPVEERTMTFSAASAGREPRAGHAVQVSQ